VITDGENHEDDAVGAAKLAAENGIAGFDLVRREGTGL
jgi:hypothetical protein